ncbi:hypothetical protein KVP09_06565 [Alcaligenaceae bacterium CGII-47]|nr:hypothetical protein [Alcaligenaceae bacterium CGII-47]
MRRRPSTPTHVRVRMYQVGFGDCFLLTFSYPAPSPARHVLIDFGSTEAPEGVNRARMLAKIAEDIRQAVNMDPFAVVATHRHADHIAGFDPGVKEDGPGVVIAALKPRWVVQPWTEQRDLPVEAVAPAHFKGMALRRASLERMQVISQQVMDREIPRLKRSLGATSVIRELAFLGEDNLGNARAVENLAKMGRNDYVYAGKRTRLQGFLPGVKVHVLGPPTVTQSAAIKRQRSADPDEFWLAQSQAFGISAQARETEDALLFEGYPQVTGGSASPEARWLVHAVRRAQSERLLGIVRSLDKAMNNTSVILLFEFGEQKLLFPGDAQIENWEYALGRADFVELLHGVNVYKVGHHGSRNATPKTLWQHWFPDDRVPGASKSPETITSMMSTKPGKHGDERIGTEVPRRALVTALRERTHLVATDAIGNVAYVDALFGQD